MARAGAIAAALVFSLLAAAAGGATSEQTPRRGGTVVIGTLEGGEPPCLNAFIDACAVPGQLDRGLNEVLAAAFDVEPDGTFRPSLVSDAYIVSRRPFTLVYHIRPEAHWSDGVPVTASDFIFTHHAIVEHRPALDYDPAFVRSILPLDSKTFRLVLRAPFSAWRYLFRMVLPRHVLAGQDLEHVWTDSIDNPRTGKPIGSGPFLIGSFERGRQLTLVRNPRYWGAHVAYLDRIAFRFLPVQDLADALRRGDIDMINPGSRVTQAQALELRHRPAPGIRVTTVPSASLEHIDIRIGAGGHPALQTRLVRQALAYGIDRAAIARDDAKLSFEDESALEPLDSVVFLANSPYYRRNWKRYDYKPARARELLEQAGCRRGSDDVYSCAGKRLSLRFETTAGVETREHTFEVVQAELRQVGVEVIPVFVQPALFFESSLYGGDWDLALFAPSLGGGLGATWPGKVFQCQQPESNTTGYCDRLVSGELEQATRIIQDSRRVGLLNRVDQRLATAVPVIPLYQDAGLVARKATVRGVAASGPGGNFTWNSENWWLAPER